MTAPTRLTLQWTEALRLEASNDKGSGLELDSNGREGVAPTEALLASVAGCMAVDVVTILEKMRLDLRKLRVEIEGERAESPPRYFRSIQMVFRVSGEIPRERLEHAVALSLEKYCSVFHSLRKDLKVETRVSIDED